MYEIGQKVSWKINQFNMSGAVLQDMGETVKVMTHFRNNCPTFVEVEVKKGLLTKI